MPGRCSLIPLEFDHESKIVPFAFSPKGVGPANPLTKQIGTKISVSNSIMDSNVSARGVKSYALDDAATKLPFSFSKLLDNLRTFCSVAATTN